MFLIMGYAVFLIMGYAGFISSTVGVQGLASRVQAIQFGVSRFQV